MSIEAIKKALEAGPTEGPWVTDPSNPNCVAVEGEHFLYVCEVAPSEFSAVEYSQQQEEADAAYIAACHPQAIRELIDRLEAAEAALQWRPIETAPKDGTEIALLFPAEATVLGKSHGRVRAASWCGDWTIPYMSHNRPTHWMPLPSAPEARSKE